MKKKLRFLKQVEAIFIAFLPISLFIKITGLYYIGTISLMAYTITSLIYGYIYKETSYLNETFSTKSTKGKIILFVNIMLMIYSIFLIWLALMHDFYLFEIIDDIR